MQTVAARTGGVSVGKLVCVRGDNQVHEGGSFSHGLTAWKYSDRPSHAAASSVRRRVTAITAKKHDGGDSEKKSKKSASTTTAELPPLEDTVPMPEGMEPIRDSEVVREEETHRDEPYMFLSDSDTGDSISKRRPQIANPDLDSEKFEAKAHYPDEAIAASKDSEVQDKKKKKKKKSYYEKELDRLQVELVKLQEWVRKKGLRVVVIFEGRDAAGKGGILKTIADATNPRVVRIVALAAPSDRERTQWYFQRYVAHLPAAGEMILFDRSWYNRAGVERVMGFCTEDEYKEFLRSCPEFERMLVRSGIVVLKYWISVSAEEQEKRFKERLARPEKRWKLSDMDLQARARWSDYSQAKDIMFSYTDIKQAPWYVVPADNKKAARLNCISHIISKIPYEDLIVPNDLKLPPLQEDHYVRPPLTDQTFVPQKYDV